jgi:methylmalonyl-CoA epimerase
MFNKDCYLDHVALAVRDLDRTQKIYEDLGIKFNSEREVVASQGVTTAFAHIDQHAHLELLCPLENSGAVFNFLEKNGEGIHHLSFKVPDVKKKCEELKSQGYKLIYENPVPGANNCLVNFVHPKSSGGVLLEISEDLKK